MKFIADFETTTDVNDCRIWAFALCEIGNTDNIIYGNNIDEFMRLISGGLIGTVYFHNLKFDGEFIIHWLFNNGFTHTTDRKTKEPFTFSTLISDRGLFYSMKIVFESCSVKLLDSLKILPFKVAEISEAFNLPMSKGEINYTKTRPIGYKMDEEERDYIRRDVVIVAEALDILFKQDLKKMTQGSNALGDFKKIIGNKKFARCFPPPLYDSDIRQSYKGGWTFLNEKYIGKEVKEGIILDVNSLYPWVMYHCNLPYGEGKSFRGRIRSRRYLQHIRSSYTLSVRLKQRQIANDSIKRCKISTHRFPHGLYRIK